MNVNAPRILFSVEDYRKISSYLGGRRPSPVHEALEGELSRAEVLDASELPMNVVRLNSAVEFRDHKSGKVRKIQIVAPAEADPAAGKVSFLAPVGAALIGLAERQSIDWKMPVGGIRRFEVLAVSRPEVPERAEKARVA